MDVLELFREQGTVDELGIGTVRDAIADILFPGTSTIQTRARYFLFVPWIYLGMEQRRVPSHDIAAKARRVEIGLIEALLESEDLDGVIGKRARKGLKRLPSDVYWNGLRTWGIRWFSGSQEDYYRSLDAFYASSERAAPTEEGESPQGPSWRNWHRSIPSPPNEFPEEASLALTEKESQYLRERILHAARGSLLAFLVDCGDLDVHVEFAWQHSKYGEFSKRNRIELEHARNFSEAMQGAPLLYNLMLSELRKNDEMVAAFTGRLGEWAGRIVERAGDFSSWDTPEFWKMVTSGGARIPHPTRVFSEAWLEMALSSGVTERIAGEKRARRLIRDRERRLKGGLARLENRRALDMWGGDSGTAQIDYRWPITQRIVSDILEGLARDA